VVIVHGMGEQLPLATLNRFVKTALPRVDGRRLYYSRPERVTDSYEARRLLAFRTLEEDRTKYGQTEFFEYHWSYMMKENKFGDLFPALRRLIFRRPSRVPAGLKAVWWIAWLLLLVTAAIAAYLVFVAVASDQSVSAVVVSLIGGFWLALILAGLKYVQGIITKTFVDVVRYLDRSPRSYEVRRAIRKGMVDLLKGLHDRGRYSRIIVVAHSLGAYIAYDGISYLWPQMANLHCGPVHGGEAQPLQGLDGLQTAANDLNDPAGATDPNLLTTFRERQFDLWRGLRMQGNPWLVTDFISVGTPMYFADLLYTKNRSEFNELARRAELPMCPPTSATQTVEGDVPARVSYGFNNRGRHVLAHGTPFAAVRWTNLYFPVEYGLLGDWFGGRLQPLFGRGVLDIPVTGNRPGRRVPGLAHSRYFRYPDDLGANDVATLLRRHLRLDLQAELAEIRRTAPTYDPETDPTR
jgi:hypothetical protein